ncbi:M12 family metallo-peptidase [Acanthopleuribacter pedis]|uniref:Peptidase M12B domain-containing protein n=1 Tax=Acanthopleuribacter pedis TaxID=442870 RepID=A0A8J7Q4F3_9BACT|nr:M12 family metallo-peptidase [Acanthopleuribacter pedis]MBO1320392.1 hypothetical protein [Acanthopleuribacter pedis]
MLRFPVWKSWRLLWLCAWLTPLWSTTPIISHVGDANLALDAFSLGIHEAWTIQGLHLPGHKAAVDLQLERFLVFRPDSEIVVHGRDGDTLLQAPQHAYFRGSIIGKPNARVFLTIDENGDKRGLITDGGVTWQFGEEAAGKNLTALARTSHQPSAPRAYQCGAAKEHGPAVPPSWHRPLAPAPLPKELLGDTYTATLAIESDFEFYHQAGGADQALDYLGDLIGAVSVIYTRELSTQLSIGHVSLWSDQFDPWHATDPVAQIEEFGDYWNQEHRGTPRTLATFLSGRRLGGGYAWLDALCDPRRGYSVSTNLSGAFNTDNPFTTWDLTIVAHEIGHNFGAEHTHCMSPAVDQCSDECVPQRRSLPCGDAGGGCGTIMSYCHLISGGQANIALTLGLGHPHGFQPERVPQNMQRRVQAVANQQPTCLPRGCAAPKIAREPADARLCFGDSIRLTVEVIGDQTRFQWFKEGHAIPNATHAQLELNKVDEKNRGSYYCVIEGACGMVTSRTAKIEVAENAATVAPSFVIQGLKPITLRANLECTSDFSNWHWFDRTRGQALGFTNQATATLPALPGATTVALRFGEGSNAVVIGTARVLAARDEGHHDVNGDGCNDPRDITALAVNWPRSADNDPDGDGRFSVLDFLYLNTHDGCL